VLTDLAWPLGRWAEAGCSTVAREASEAQAKTKAVCLSPDTTKKIDDANQLFAFASREAASHPRDMLALKVSPSSGAPAPAGRAQPRCAHAVLVTVPFEPFEGSRCPSGQTTLLLYLKRPVHEAKCLDAGAVDSRCGEVSTRIGKEEERMKHSLLVAATVGARRRIAGRGTCFV